MRDMTALIEHTTAVTVEIDGTTHRHEGGCDWIDYGDQWAILDADGRAVATYPAGRGAIIRREVARS